jgi:hypothetical protein
MQTTCVRLPDQHRHACLHRDVTVHHTLLSPHKVYLVTDHGRIDVEGMRLAPRDGVAVSGEPSVSIRARDDTDVAVVELLRKRWRACMTALKREADDRTAGSNG